MVNVIHIHLHSLWIAGVLASVDLPIAGNTWLDRKQLWQKFSITSRFCTRDHPRANQGQVSRQQAEELREFVNAEFTEKSSDAQNAWIIFQLVLFGELLLEIR